MKILNSKIIHLEHGDLFCFLGEQGERHIVIEDLQDYFGLDFKSYISFSQKQFVWNNDDAKELKRVIEAIRCEGDTPYFSPRYSVSFDTRHYNELCIDVTRKDYKYEEDTDGISFSRQDIANKRHLELADFLESHLKDIQ